MFADAGIRKVIRRETDADGIAGFGHRYVDAYWYRRKMVPGENRIREAEKLGVEPHSTTC